MKSSGFVLILLAAKAAEEHFKDHQQRLERCQTSWGRRMAVSGLFGDIERIVEDLPTYERE